MAKKQSNEQFLYDVRPENCFWCCDGKIMKNLYELESGLKKMNVKTFSYHTNKEKNDFSRWVEEIVGDKKLATDLKKCKDKKSASSKVAGRIKSIKK